VRRGRWQPYITSGEGRPGESPDRSLFSNGTSFDHAAREYSNVSIATDGTIEPRPGARLPTETVSSKLLIQQADGRIAPDEPYVIDAAGWNALSTAEQIKVVAAFAADRLCPASELRRIAEALRTGKFVVANDDVESTLASWCGGDTPGQAPQGRDPQIAQDGDSANPPSVPCGSVKYRNRYERGALRVVVTGQAVPCAEARRIIARAGNHDFDQVGKSNAEGYGIEAWRCFGGREGDGYHWHCSPDDSTGEAAPTIEGR
jgi:hypothetical protein